MEALVEICAVTRGPKHHFFGYYDKCPWDKTGRYMIGLETEFMDRPPGPKDKAVIGLIDTEKDNLWQPLAETHAWNWQQGTRLEWLWPNTKRIIYNSVKDDKFVSVIHDISSGDKRILPRPIYAVSHDSKSALSLNFARLHHTRPGYGYAGPADPWEDEPAPDQDGIYWMNLETGENRLIISLAQILTIAPDESMKGAKHWFNHLLFNPAETRFVFLHRWADPEKKSWSSRFLSANVDGSDIYCIVHEKLISHFDWYDDDCVLVWARQSSIGDYFYLCNATGPEKEIVGKDILTYDGHCSYSPDRRWILTDLYPDENLMMTLILYCVRDNKRIDIAKILSSSERGEIRCDLHPRWSRNGTQVCFDSIHEGTRQMYVADVADIVSG